MATKQRTNKVSSHMGGDGRNDYKGKLTVEPSAAIRKKYAHLYRKNAKKK